MSTLRRLVSDPTQLMHDVLARVSGRVFSSIQPPAPTERVRRRALPVGGRHPILDAFMRAIEGTTSAFTTPTPNGPEQLNCFADDIPWMVYRAAVVAEQRKGRLLLTARRKTHEVPSRSAAVVTSKIKSVAWFELVFCRKGLEETVGVAVWERRDSEGVGYCRTQNSYAKRLPLEMFERLAHEGTRRIDLRALYECPIDSACSFDVDAVCWAGERLVHTLRSIAVFAPWVKTIHVVGAGERPAWLLEHPQIRWVREEAVARPALRYALESRLTQIDGLTEHFVFFDRSTFLGAQTHVQDFFAPNGMSISYLEARGTVAGDVDATKSSGLNAAIRARRLIETTCGVSPTQLHAAAPHALCKTVLAAMEERFSSAFADVRESGAEIAIATFLYHHYAFQTCDAQRTVHHSAMRVDRQNGAETYALMLSGKRKRFFGVEESDDRGHVARTAEFLESYLPEKAAWES